MLDYWSNDILLVNAICYETRLGYVQIEGTKTEEVRLI